MSFQQILALSVTEIIGDFALKEFANKGGLLPLSIGIGGYVGVVYTLIVALQGSTVLLVNGAWDGISALVESIAAYIFLGERFHSFSQYIGLFLIIFGVYLLKIPRHKKFPFHFPTIESK
jgi:multidrug transporter EmrE-like cation transporter